MKKSLLTLSLLAVAATASAEDRYHGEFYLIKDGKFCDGVEVLEYDDPTEGPAVKEGVAIAGETAVTVTPKQYSEARFYVADGIDLTKTWNIEIEFYYNAGDLDSASHASANKWAAIDMGYAVDTTGGIYTIGGAVGRTAFDVKVKDAPGKWNTESQFVYVSPTIPTVKEVFFAWQREIDETTKTLGPVYIKNLKFVGDGNKPFYYESFNRTANPSSPSASSLESYLVDEVEGTVTAQTESSVTDPFGAPNGFVSPLPYYAGMAEGSYSKQASVGTVRLFEPNAHDESDFYDAEILHAINLVVPTGTSTRNAKGRNGRTFVLIPLDGAVMQTTENLTLQFLAKWDASRTNEPFADEIDETKMVLPVKYAFVDDATEAAQCDLTLATTDLMAGKWTEYSVEIPFVTGKKYFALVYDKPTSYSYVVDNVRLKSDRGTLKNATATATEITAFELLAQKDNKVENILSNAKVVVYPVPATDNVTVSNEGVETVEVVNAAGAVVASANGNTVNVSNLASGMYIVKAYTAAGVLVAKIVK